MAGANECQGLKIAVAAFLTISVILAVVSFFLYSAYTSAQARLALVTSQNQELIRGQRMLQAQNADLKLQVIKLPEPRTKQDARARTNAPEARGGHHIP